MIQVKHGKHNSERGRQSNVAADNEKGTRHQDREASESEEVGHQHNDRTFAKGGRRQKYPPAVTPESLAAYLAQQTKEIGL